MLNFNNTIGNYNNESFIQNNTSTPVTLYLTLLPLKIVAILATVFLNFMIIIIILVKIKVKTVSNFLFLLLACSDLLVGLISLTSMTIYTTYQYWPLGYSYCVFWVINDFSTSSISLVILFQKQQQQQYCNNKNNAKISKETKKNLAKLKKKNN